MTDKYGYEGPEQFRPLSPWAYFGYSILFAIPLVGFILLIVFSLSNQNINRRNYLLRAGDRADPLRRAAGQRRGRRSVRLLLVAQAHITDRPNETCPAVRQGMFGRNGDLE